MKNHCPILQPFEKKVELLLRAYWGLGPRVRGLQRDPKTEKKVAKKIIKKLIIKNKLSNYQVYNKNLKIEIVIK